MTRVSLPQIDRFSLRRHIVCVLPQKRSPETDKLTRNLQRANRRVNTALSESLKRLSTISEERVPHIEALIQLIYRDSNPIAATFDPVLFPVPRHHRVGVFLIDVSDDDNDVPFDTGQISHFVEVLLAPSLNSQGWFASRDGASASVSSTADNLEALIHDVLLDIAVYNAMASSFAPWSDLEGRRAISALKVRFADEQALPSFFGPRVGDDLRYFSFATACRTADGFDYEGYLNVWQRFGEWVRSDGDSGGNLPTVEPLTPPSTLERMRQLFRFFNQMPLRVRKEIAVLPSGKYHIVFPLRRPAITRTRDSVASFFSRPSWRRGVFLVLADAEFERVTRSRKIAHWLEVGYLGTFTMVVP